MPSYEAGGPPTLLIRDRRIPVAGTLLMGVVNASPESFSDGQRYRSLDARRVLCDELVAAGADIVDIGGQSAITNRPEIEATEEIERVLPLVRWMGEQHPDVLVSVDTYKPTVVDAVLGAGASIINDVSGLARPEVAASCAQAGSALVVMHTRARPKVRLQDPALYADVPGDVVADVVGFLAERMGVAVGSGLPAESVIVDPGPDFTKTPHQTVAVLRALDEVRALGRPVLLAISRKDFLGAILRKSPRQRHAGTLGALALLAAVPGNIARVHDVAAARDVLDTVEVLTGRRDVDADYVLPDELRYEPESGDAS